MLLRLIFCVMALCAGQSAFAAFSRTCSGGYGEPNIQQAYADCAAQGAAFVAGITPTQGDGATFTCASATCPGYAVSIFLDTTYNAHGAIQQNTSAQYHAAAAGCPAAGSGYTNSYGNVITKAGFLKGGQAFCDNGCDSTFTLICDDPSKACVGVGSPGAWYANPGYITYTGGQCSPTVTGPPVPPGAKDANGSECQGNDCAHDPPKICETQDGKCVDASGPPSCSTDATSALCVGNPPPTPPNPPITPGTPINNYNWTINNNNTSGGGPTSTSDSNNPPPDNTGCQVNQKMVNGSCVSLCPTGQSWNGQGCTGACQPGQSMQNGQCSSVCPTGQSLSGTGCVSTCPTGSVADSNGVCSGGDLGTQGNCPHGAVRNSFGTCTGTCASGTSLNPATGTCVATCPTNTSNFGNGICTTSNCSSIPGAVVGLDGQCTKVCPPGTTVQAGACIPGNVASGGADCGAAPVCSGDQILCNIDFQAWQTRCALTGSKLMPDSSDYGVSHAASEVTGANDDGSTAISGLNASGWLGGSGACPALPSVAFMGHSFNMASWVPCSVLHILGVLILCGGYVQAAFIIGGRR